MKAAMNKITDSAKSRDTIGRNRVSVLKDTQSFGARLFDYQNNFSSDNVEKLTTVVLVDELSKSTFILKYRVQVVVGDTTFPNPNDLVIWNEFLKFRQMRNRQGDDNDTVIEEVNSNDK